MKKTNFFIALLSVLLIFNSSCQTKSSQKIPSAKPKTPTDSLCYSLGVIIGNQLKMSYVEEINTEMIAKGLLESIQGAKGGMTLEEAQVAINKYIMAVSEKRAEKNLEEGKKFLETNKSKEGVQSTASGLQYKVITAGNGAIPVDGDMISAHYHGTLLNDSVFDSSVERGQPFQFEVGGRVIQGWNEVVKLMPVGSKYKVWIPAELGYGTQVRPGGIIEPNSVLVFEIEVLEILPKKAEEGK